MDSFNKISAIYLVGTTILFISCTQLCSAQNQPEDYVREHNILREEVNVPPVRWNATIADEAHAYAMGRISDCVLKHSDMIYAENIAGGDVGLTGEGSVKLWATEKQYWDAGAKVCTKGEHWCGHYLNMIASKTTDIGCARVRCNNDGYFVICDYWAAYGL